MDAADVMGLRIEGLVLSLGGVPLLTVPDLAVAAGEVVTVMGPSGSGKSSLLAWLTGSLAPAFRAEGRAWVGGEEITRVAAHRRRVGILFQDDLLFPHMTVAENLAYGLHGRGARRARVEAALADAELAGFGERDPATLSGGQRARVALMRMLLSEPRALLLDEPFGAFDAGLRERMRRFVFERAVRSALPTLLVTHDAADACGRVVRIEGGTLR